MSLFFSIVNAIRGSKLSSSSVSGSREKGVARRLMNALVTIKTAVFGSSATFSASSSTPSNPTEESLVTKEIDKIIENVEFGKDEGKVEIDLGDNTTLLGLLNSEVSIPKDFDSSQFESFKITFDEFAFMDPKQLSSLSRSTNIHVKTLELMQAVVSRTFNSNSNCVSTNLVHIFQRLVNSGCPKAKDGKYITTGNHKRDIEISKQVKDTEKETNTQNFEYTYSNILNRFNLEDKKSIQHTFSKIQPDPEDIKINQEKSEDMDLDGVDRLIGKLKETDLFYLFDGDPSKPVQLSSSMQETLDFVLTKLERQLKDALGKNNADHNGIQSILSAFQSDIQEILSNSISNAKKGKGDSFELVKEKDLKSQKLPAMKELAVLLAVFSPNKDVWDKEFLNMKIDLSKPPKQAKGFRNIESQKTATTHGSNFGSNQSPQSSPRSVLDGLGAFFPKDQVASAAEQAAQARVDIQERQTQKVQKSLDARDRKRDSYNRDVQQRRSEAATAKGLEISVNPLSILDYVADQASRGLSSFADQFGVEARKITIESLNKLLPASRSRPLTEDDLERLEENQEKRDLRNMLKTRGGVDARTLIYDEARFNEFSQGLKNIERDIKVLYSQERKMTPEDIQREVGKILNSHSIRKEDATLYENLLFLWQR